MAKMSKKERELSGVLFVICSIGCIIFSIALFFAELLFYFLIVAAVVVSIGFILFFIYKIYERFYFKGDQFLEVKQRINSHISDCNNLNRHIEDLKNTELIINKSETGKAEYCDDSDWNLKRPELKGSVSAINIHNCSRTVCDNARKSPFKYVCKYFGVSADEETLTAFENILNNFEAAEEGKTALTKERELILSGIYDYVPFLIRQFSIDRLEHELGFDPVDLNPIKFPQYIFKYTSSGGNASTKCTVTMDVDNLNSFIEFLSDKIKFKKSAAGQRALMTSKLRTSIKERDGYTCKVCKASVQEEPHLLLEIDHIIPISRGGITTESNLQTLCWRCNRSKGAKMQ